MKHYKFLAACLVSSLAFFTAACNDDEDGGSQFQLGMSGCVTLQLPYQKADTLLQVSVVNRSMQANTVKLSLLTQEELDAYNRQWKTDYLMIPEAAYLLEQNSISFSSGEREKSVNLTIYPTTLYTNLLQQTESAKSYCLPLKMEDNTGNSDNVVYVAELSYPEMRITNDSEINLDVDAMTENVQLQASIFENGVEISNGEERTFTLAMPADKTEWLAKFNAAQGVNYTILPESYYSVTPFTGAADDKKCTGSVTINRRPEGQELLAKGNYVLPLVPRNVDATSTVVLKYDTVALVINNPEHVFTSSDKVDRSDWRIVFCNSDMGVWNSDGIVTNMLDGNTETFWASWYQWWNGQDTWWNEHGRGSDWCDYGLEFMTYKEQNGVGDMFSEGSRKFLSDDYIFIAGNRDYPTFVIDMGREYYVSEVGMQHRKQIQWAQTKSCDIYISNDPEFKLTTVREGGSVLNYETVNENNWVHVCTINTERSEAEFWATANLNDARLKGTSKGRFLKFVGRTPLPEGNATHDNSLQYAGVGELYLKEVAAIDGEPYEAE